MYVSIILYFTQQCHTEATSYPYGNGRNDVKEGSWDYVNESEMCLIFYALRDNAILKLLPTLPRMIGMMKR